MAPDRFQLQRTTKKTDESFREHALRWRELAAQVKPPMSEKEMVTIFLGTLQASFYDKLVGSVPASFADLVTAGE